MTINMTDKNRDIKIAVIQEKVGNIEEWQKNADLNHFPTIEKRFDGVELKIARWGGGLAVLVILVPLIIKIL